MSKLQPTESECGQCGKDFAVSCDYGTEMECPHCGEMTEVGLPDFELGDDDIVDEPEEGDYTTEDHLNFYSYGKLVLSIGEDADMWQAIKTHMDAEGFYPNVWWISDHGNAHLMTPG